MNNSIIEILPKDLKVVKSLKELSYDSFNSEYMTESEITAIDFDKVKDSYIINNLESVNPNPKSNDALYISDNKTWTFIEFKNGIIDDKVNFELNKKIYDSLSILFDIDFTNSNIEFINCISFTRKNMNYMLVYNKEKNKSINTTNHKAGEKRQKNKVSLQNSESRDYLGKSISRRAGREFIKFGLDQFKGYFFNEVFTYTKEEFENEFVKMHKDN